MKSILSIFFLLSLNFGFGHDIKMAIFEIFKGDENLEITISIDREVFMNALAENCSESLVEHEFQDAAWEYLDSHLKVFVNDQFGSLEIEEIEFGEQNMFLKGSLNISNDSVEEIKEVRMENTCLIDAVEGHSNVMKLKLNDRYRSFRLDSDRISTSASY